MSETASSMAILVSPSGYELQLWHLLLVFAIVFYRSVVSPRVSDWWFRREEIEAQRKRQQSVDKSIARHLAKRERAAKYSNKRDREAK